MQPSVQFAATGEREQAEAMENVMLAVRRLWFGATVVPLGGAVGVVESGGEMVMCVDEDGPGADRLIAAAATRGAYVVATGFSRPDDLGSRLRLGGFTVVQAHGTYVLDEAGFDRAMASEPEQSGRKGLLTMLWHRERAPVEVRVIDELELATWNGVCWRAFGSRATEAASLLDKQTAFRNMGRKAKWYLATVRGRPAGTAIVYQERDAAQILAVGTLPALQGRGVASALMKRVVLDWRREGQGFLFLDTSPGSRAERLYMKLGFVPAYLREIYAPVVP